jgi:hypothetical protein
VLPQRNGTTQDWDVLMLLIVAHRYCWRRIGRLSVEKLNGSERGP